MTFDEGTALTPESPQSPETAPRSVEPVPVTFSPLPASAPLPQEFYRPGGRFIPEDLRVPWGWLDLLLVAILPLAGTILLSILLAMLFSAFGVSPSQLQHSPAYKSLWAILNQAVLFLVLLGYLVAQMRLRFSLPFWRTIGWRPLEAGRLPSAFTYLRFIGGGFFLALLVQIVSARFGAKVKLPMETLFQDRRAAVLLLLMAVLVAPVIEETIFRGYIYPVVARSFGVGAGILATGTLFGLLHAPQLWGGWMQIVLLVIVGIVFTYVRAVTKTVLASYLFHVSYNSFVSLAFLIGTHGLRVLNSGS
jgi:membrane protease YdiL (CAAX protease family)